MQFGNSSVLQQILAALVSEVQVLAQAVANVQSAVCLYNAAGVNLDILGRIVGVSRSTWVSDSVLELLAEDGDNLWTEDAQDIIGPVGSALMIGDTEYANSIMIKILCNINQYSSIPEINNVIYQATGMNFYFQRVGPMQIQVVAPASLTSDQIQALLRKYITERTDDRFILPYPATLEVSVAESQNILIETGDELWDELGDNILSENYLV